MSAAASAARARHNLCKRCRSSWQGRRTDGCGGAVAGLLSQVVYVDGETDWLWMGVERVRLLITAGEELPRPDAVTLQQLAQRCAGVNTTASSTPLSSCRLLVISAVSRVACAWSVGVAMQSPTTKHVTCCVLCYQVL